jgi:Na+-transporting NADH:ubiquinone oxidoreductase subunit NqrF
VKEDIIEQKVPPIKIKPRPKGKLEKQRLKEQARVKAEVKVKHEVKMELDSEPDEPDVSIEAVVFAAPKTKTTPKPQVMEIIDGNEQVTVIVLD